MGFPGGYGTQGFLDRGVQLGWTGSDLGGTVRGLCSLEGEMRPDDPANSADHRSAYAILGGVTFDSAVSPDGRSANARWGSPSLPDGRNTGGNLGRDYWLSALNGVDVSAPPGVFSSNDKHDVSTLTATPWMGVIDRELESEPRENGVFSVVYPSSRIERSSKGCELRKSRKIENLPARVNPNGCKLRTSRTNVSLRGSDCDRTNLLGPNTMPRFSMEGFLVRCWWNALEKCRIVNAFVARCWWVALEKWGIRPSRLLYVAK